MNAEQPPSITEDLARIFENLEDAIIVSDPSGRFLFVNPMGAELLGFASPEALLGANLAEILGRFAYHDLDGNPVPSEQMPTVAAARGERPPVMELCLRNRATGKERWAPISATPLFDANGKLCQVVTILRETTAQRRSEQALRLLAAASARLGDSLNYHITLKEVVKLLVPELADWCAIEVYQADGIRELVADADVNVEKRPLARKLLERPWFHPRPDNGEPAKPLNPTEIHFFSHVQDEDLQRAAEDETHLALLRAANMKSFISVPLYARNRMLGVVRAVMSSSGRFFEEHHLSLLTELAARAALAVDNARLYERTEAALALKNEEARTSETLRRLGNSISSELDPAQLAQRVCDEASTLCGAEVGVFLHTLVDERGEPRQFCASRGLLPLQPEGQVEAVLSALFQHGSVCVADVSVSPCIHPFHGGEKPLRSYLAVAVMSRSGEGVGALCFGHSAVQSFTQTHVRLMEDVAAHAAIGLDNARLFQQLRNAQEGSHSSEERLRLALDAGKMGYFDWDLITGKAFNTPRMMQILGVDPERSQGTLDTYLSRVHPDDRHKLSDQMVRMVEEGISEDTALYRTLHADGTVRWIESHTRLVRDSQGLPIRSLGVAMDITERKQAEEQSRKLVGEQAARTEAESAQRRISAILDSISEPLFALDRDWRFRFLNRRAERLLGKRREEVVGRGAWEERPFKVDPTLLQQCDRAMVEGTLVEFEARLPDGLWYELRASPFDEGLSLYLRDVTARKREQEAQARLARYDALRADVSVAVSGQGVLSHVLQRCCEAMVRHLGVDVARIWTIEPLSEVMELQASAGRFTMSDGMFSRIPLKQFDFDYYLPDRRPFWTNDAQNHPRIADRQWVREQGFVSFARFPLVVDQQLIGLLSMHGAQKLPEDMVPALSAISDALAQGIERRSAEQKLAAHAAELIRSNTELEQFAYVASHDLQEPLRMVASYTQLLAKRYKGRLDPDADVFIGFAVDAVTRMKRLISDLLLYSRVGTKGKEFVPLSLPLVLERVLLTLQVTLEENGAQVTFDPLPDVLGDEVQLEQLLQNLLGNALKFRSTAPPQVHVSVDAFDRKWVFAVRDNGIGIDPQYFQRIFVIFQRLHGKDEYPGTGIGLAICKKIVERHGGRIWVESKPGDGCTFFFTLPMLEAAEPDTQRSAS